MKTTITLIFAALVAAFASAQSAPAPDQASAARQKLEVWLGDWAYETTLQASPLGQAGTYRGSHTVRPILGGQFIEFRGEESGPDGTFQWTETDGFDPANNCYIWKSFASDGSICDITYTFDGHRAPFSGTLTVADQSFPIRGTMTFADDFCSMTDTREISLDGKTWQPLSEARATKILKALASSPQAEEELLALEKSWAAAYLAADVEMLDRIEAESWVCTNEKGQTFNKADDLRVIGDGSYRATTFDMSDLKVQVYGDTAVITGRQTEQATYKGEDASATYRITDVWLLRDGRWQAIASHLSREEAE